MCDFQINAEINKNVSHDQILSDQNTSLVTVLVQVTSEVQK